MEVLCFAAGIICGVLIMFFIIRNEHGTEPASESGKMPKELRLQYESLFGYDGTGNEN